MRWPRYHIVILGIEYLGWIIWQLFPESDTARWVAYEMFGGFADHLKHGGSHKSAPY